MIFGKITIVIILVWISFPTTIIIAIILVILYSWFLFITLW